MKACLINGLAITSLALSDRAIQYGDGLFETIALKQGVMPFWSEHFQRLSTACEQLKFSIPNEALLLQEIDTVKQGLDQAVIKIILTRGSGERGYRIPSSNHIKRIVQCYPFPDIPFDNYQLGIRACFCKTPVSENIALAGIKHLNRLDNVLAASEWQDKTIAEGLMCNAKGHVIQGTKTNIFCVQAGNIYTPDLNSAGILGIMRAQILQWAKQQDMRVHIQDISRDELLLSSEIFVCNSIIGIWPVRELEGHIFPIGKLTQTLLEYFK